MLIGYISPTNPFEDRKAWSGTYFNTRKALEKAGHQVEWIPYKNGGIMDKIFRKGYRLFYGNGSYVHSSAASWLHTKSIKEDLEKYDLLFIPGQVDIVAGLKNVTTPIIYYTDGTVPLMIDYYWFNFSKRAIKEAVAIEKKAMCNAHYNWFASQWAAQSAINDYDIAPKNVDVFPFGPGIEDKNINKLHSHFNRKLKLIFSGVDWKRKGGQIAVNAAEELNNRGISTELIMCGINELPKSVSNKPFIKNMGFLNKNIPGDFDKYQKIWRQADILILPTRAECAGIVFSEAAEYGVPVITTDTGGVGTYVKNNFNGKRLPLSANGNDYADEIECWINNNDISRLSSGASQIYTEEISWTAWKNHFNKTIGNVSL